MLNLRLPRSHGGARRRGPLRVLAFALCSLLVLASSAAAGPVEQARRMHDRLVGIPPSDPVLQDMVDLLTATPADRRWLMRACLRVNPP